jgi:flagellar biosynthetic protein FliR
MPFLETFLSTGVFAFLIVFVRLGTACMIMPGVGDSLTPASVRLYIALGLCLVLTPVVMRYLPARLPGGAMLIALLCTEFIVGLFLGTVARILITALDTAGMLVSTASGLGSAQMLNPAFATQGSLVGAFLSVTGVLVFFAANMHRFLFEAIVKSYHLFPIGEVPDTSDMLNVVTHTVSVSFAAGVSIAGPFLVLSVLIYVWMGVLSRLMPAIQIFLIAVPLQIIISLLALSLTVSAIFLYWLAMFRDGMTFALTGGG